MAIELPLEAFWKENLEIDELSERLPWLSLPFSHAKCSCLGLERARTEDNHVTLASFVALATMISDVGRMQRHRDNPGGIK